MQSGEKISYSSPVLETVTNGFKKILNKDRGCNHIQFLIARLASDPVLDKSGTVCNWTTGANTKDDSLTISVGRNKLFCAIMNKFRLTKNWNIQESTRLCLTPEYQVKVHQRKDVQLPANDSETNICSCW